MTGKPSPEALDAAARILARARARRDSIPPAQAAREAYVPGGPSLAELERRIRARRGLPPLSDTA